MAREEAPISGFMLATQPNKQHFQGPVRNLDVEGEYTSKDDLHSWSQAELDTLDSVEKFADVIVSRIEKNTDAVVKEAYAIAHDKDTCEVWSELKRDYLDINVDEHYHVAVFFTSAKATLTEISEALGIAPNMIEKPKRGKFAVDNMKSYLIHAKDSSKHLYNPHEVYTARGKDYVELWCEKKKTWEKGRSVKTKKRLVDDVDWLADKARKGEVTKGQILGTPEYRDIWSWPDNTDKIEKALQNYAVIRMSESVKQLSAREFAKTTLYLEGEAGYGKTKFIEGLLALVSTVFGWDFARLAGQNALDDYYGEDVIWLEDTGSEALPNFQTWKTFLDPHTPNAAPARYKNKPPMAPKLIIITSNEAPVQFFYYAHGIKAANRARELDAILRRLLYVPVNNAFEKKQNYSLLLPVVGETNAIDTIQKLYGSEEIEHRYSWEKHEDKSFNAYGAARVLLDVIAKNAGIGEVEEDVYLVSDECIYEAFKGAIEHEALPELPAPGDTSENESIDTANDDEETQETIVVETVDEIPTISII